MIRLFATLIIFVSSSGYACECSQILSYKEYAAKASIIFIGQLIRAEIIENGDHAAEFTFSIGEAFRGVETDRLTVKKDITSCTLPMNIGRQYLVFTNPGQGINICSGSGDIQRVNFPEIEHLRGE